MNPIITDDYLYILQWEGYTKHLYLDSLGYATIGVGCMIQDRAACVRLDMVDRLDHQPASDLEKMNEYARVIKAPTGYTAGHYSQYTHLEMTPLAIRKLCESRLEGCRVGLRLLFKGYDTFPVGPKLALLDMGYNMGIGGLAKFRRLHIAVESHDWPGAAAESHRAGVRDLRNQSTRDLFVLP